MCPIRSKHVRQSASASGSQPGADPYLFGYAQCGEVVGEAARKAEVHLDLLLDQLSDINRKERRAASEYHIRSAHHRRGLRSKPN
jgi:hypothetical protein